MVGFVIELRRGQSKARTGRTAGPRPAVGMIERYVEDGELLAVVNRFGSTRLPTLARLDPYRDHTLQGEAVASLFSELERIDLTALAPAERRVVGVLMDWARQCRGDRDLRIGFSGD
ncbi:hypothetical protein [Streptomyces sp. NPDC091268]|uniref:hypothetical protein n=1 Tax=Streptomyces sp. NPDC091268 TaxID=3365979 RepID=UPI00381E85EB